MTHKKKQDFTAEPARLDQARRLAEIDTLFVGEGWEKEGPACRRARELAQARGNRRVVAVDLREHVYPIPETLEWVTGGVLEFLETVPENSTAKIVDNGAFEEIILDVRSPNFDEDLWAEDMAFAYAIAGRTPPKGEKTPFQKRSIEYASQLYRTLVPEGRFECETIGQNVPGISMFLEDAGFEVSAEQLTRETARRTGSHQALHELEEGHNPHLITAVKPRQ
ncbi:MAG: hypothetical protein ABH851_08235 [Methanobacteriota archaeon]